MKQRLFLITFVLLFSTMFCQYAFAVDRLPSESDVDMKLTDDGLLVSVDFPATGEAAPQIAALTVRLLNEQFKAVETTSKQVILLNERRTESVLFPTKIESSQLPLYSVDIEFGGQTLHTRKTQPIERQDILLLGQDTFESGSTASTRIVVRNTGKNEGIANASVSGQLIQKDKDKTVELFQTVTDTHGSADVTFPVPEDLQGQYEIGRAHV